LVFLIQDCAEVRPKSFFNSKKRFRVRRILGCGDLWITEYILSYDGQPSHTVSIMEFRDGKVVRETQYFGDPFEASAWRAQWVERFE
jgi:hypothetical protein